MDASTIQRARARVGSVLRAKWHLDKLIGVGGMAAVYASTHRNKKRGAVKLLHTELGSNEDTRTRFLREGYVANHVDHPGAVSVLDDDVAEDGAVYLVMELLEGRNLEHILRTRASGRFEIGETLAIADAALDVLAAAHDKGIVHRDIKPDNLFITTGGQLKVLDFGIARVRKEAPSASDTATGVAIGTPMYMPPEQALGEWNKVDGRTDVWAVGASMFALLSGREVRDAENLQKLFLSAMTEPIDALGSVAPSLPQEICALVDRAVAFTMDHRFASAREMQAAVRALRARWPGTLTCDALPLDQSGPVPVATAPAVAAYTPVAPTVTAQSSEPLRTMAQTHGAPSGTPMHPTPHVAVLAAHAAQRRSPLVPILLVSAALVGVGAGVAVFAMRAPSSIASASARAEPASGSAQSTDAPAIVAAPTESIAAVPSGAPSPTPSAAATSTSSVAVSASASTVAAAPSAPPPGIVRKPPATVPTPPPATTPPKPVDPFSKY